MKTTSQMRGVDEVEVEIVITRKHMQKTPSTSSFRIFKFDDKQFRINERQIVSSSKYIQKLVANGKCPVVINLDHLKSSQPCLTADAIDIALQYAKGRAVIALNKIVEALAASNALQMWDMRTAISEQLLKLVAVPQYAPLVIAIACVDLTADWRNTILEEVFQNLEQIVAQPTFMALNSGVLKTLMNFIITKISSVNGDKEKTAIANKVALVMSNWLKNNSKNETEQFQEIVNIIKQHKSDFDPNNFKNLDEISLIETSEPKISYKDDKNGNQMKTIDEHTIHQHHLHGNNIDVIATRVAAGGSKTELTPNNQKTYVFENLTLPYVEPDTNGIKKYSFVVEFEAPKSYILSSKPKLIKLDLEAVVDCPCKDRNNEAALESNDNTKRVAIH